MQTRLGSGFTIIFFRDLLDLAVNNSFRSYAGSLLLKGGKWQVTNNNGNCQHYASKQNQP